MNTALFRRLIWSHYRTHGRTMPWRNIRDPYRILVSEIMLQQTQVSRVVEKYKEFIKQFPSFSKLADAPVSRVLHAWQGLGYNRRALSLKRLAEIVERDHGGKLPSEIEKLLALPGIGKGTAGSLSAFVFNKPIAFIETNIRRVYLHHFFPNRTKVEDDAILALVAKTVDKKNPREWYYALMDYGAMLGASARHANPNRRSAIYKKQAAFKGSRRELRGAVLRTVIASGALTESGLSKRLGKPVLVLRPVLQELVKERFLKKTGKKLTIAE